MKCLVDMFETPISGEWGDEAQNTEGVKVIRTTNFTNTGMLDLEKGIAIRDISASKVDKKRLKYGDSIIEKSGGSPDQPVGRVVFFNIKDDAYLCNNFTAILRPKKEYYPKFCFYVLYYLHKSKVVLKFQNKTTGIINLKLSDYLNGTQIPLPPLETQKKIADVLDKAQELIDKRKEQIEKLDEFVQSVFFDMFGDPVSNPKSWKKNKLEAVCEIITGNTPPRESKENYGNYVEWIKSDNINTPYHYITTADEYLSEEGLRRGRTVGPHSILMTCIAGSLGCIGNVALVNRVVAFNQQINAIVPKSINLYFLYMQFMMSKQYIQSASTNSMKGMLSKGKLSNLEFIVPANEVQLEFERIFIIYLKQRELFEKSLTQMENNFNSIMQKAFRGELF